MRFRQFLEMLSLACPPRRGHNHSTRDDKAGAQFIRIPNFPRHVGRTKARPFVIVQFPICT